MITVNVAIIRAVAEWLVIVSGGAAVMVAIVKKMLKPVLKPLKEIAEKQAEIEENQSRIEDCLSRDKKRLDKHDDILELIVKDNEMELRTSMQLINHLRTNNNTDAMKAIEDEVDRYLASRM